MADNETIKTMLDHIISSTPSQTFGIIYLRDQKIFAVAALWSQSAATIYCYKDSWIDSGTTVGAFRHNGIRALATIFGLEDEEERMCRNIHSYKTT